MSATPWLRTLTSRVGSKPSPAVALDRGEQLALAGYIDRHGIPYGPSGGTLERIRNRLPDPAVPAPSTVDPR